MCSKYNCVTCEKLYDILFINLGDMMKKIIQRIKFKLKSENGFTMQDLLAGCLILTIFVGTIAGLMTYVYKTNMQTRLMAQMTSYAVEILEDIDKISYEDAQNTDGKYYKEKFSIPAGFNIDLQFSDYGENLEDVIKIVNLKVSYKFDDETTEYKVQRLKIKEM